MRGTGAKEATNAMRGGDSYNESLFSTVSLEDFVSAEHPLRPIRSWVNDALTKMDARFSAIYEADIKGGRPSIASEKLMRAMRLQVLYSVRSERQLVEQINYNLLFRWFVGLSIEDADMSTTIEQFVEALDSYIRWYTRSGSRSHWASAAP